MAGGRLDSAKSMKLVSGASLAFAILQSICTAVLTISGIRLAIGLTAFALAGSVVAPIRWFHQDAIRIPMLIIAATGAILDLLVLSWIWRLRTMPAAQWRRREPSRKEQRSQRLQLVVAILTLLLVATETWTHAVMHNRARVHAATITNSAAARNK